MIAYLPYLVSFISLAVALFFGLRKLSHETGSLDSDTANNFAQAANAMAIRNKELVEEIKAWKEQNAELLKRVDTVERALKEEQEQRRKFEDWAHRLVYQLQSLRQTPVALEMTPGTQPDIQ